MTGNQDGCARIARKKKMNKKIKKIIRITSGILLVLVGIAGLILPFLQGILLIILGVSLVNPALGKKIIKKIKKFYHRIRRINVLK